MATAVEPLVGKTEEKGELIVLDSTGDTKITWSRHNSEETEAARVHFRALRAKHYLGFKMNRDGTKGTQLEEFDASAEEILMVPRSVGG